MKLSTVLCFALTAVLGAGAGYWLAQRGHEHPAPAAASERKVKLYQSPMHPWITSDRPGKCTICGMDLAPVYEGEAGFAADGSLVQLSSATAAVIGVHTTEARRAPLVRTLRVAGILDDDETRHRVLTARVPGRIETLHVNQVGVDVQAGEPLITLYSPDILSAQRVYVERLKAGDAAFTASQRAEARERLLQLGLEPEDVARLETSLTPGATVTVRAPAAGTVVTRAVYAGQYVQAEDTLLETGDLSTLWFIFDAYEADLGWLRVGQSVDVATPSRPGEVFTAPITFIDPNLNETTRTARVRVVIANPERRLLHRQTATGRVHLDAPETLVVPRSAVLYTRAEPLVYLERGGGAYAPQTVRLGRVGDQTIEVLAGVQPGDRVVTQGALLIDAQAQLATGGEPPPAPPAAAAAASSPDEYPANAALTPLALAAADAAAALAADDLPGYQAVFARLQASLEAYVATAEAAPGAELARLGAALRPGPDLAAARRPFEALSTAVADLARGAHLHHGGVVRVFQCPMTPVLGTGRWVQRAGPLRNPFFGADMLECGEELR